MLGEGLGIPTPLNSMLMALVKGVEMSSQKGLNKIHVKVKPNIIPPRLRCINDQFGN